MLFSILPILQSSKKLLSLQDNMVNIADIIANYLRTSRRLVVPSLGAFVVKASGEILFSELLKSDDGVLRSILATQGMSEIEVAGAIDRFTFEIRNEVETKNYCVVGTLGVLRRGAMGSLVFTPLPKRTAVTLQMADSQGVVAITEQKPRLQPAKPVARPAKPVADEREEAPRQPRKVDIPERYRPRRAPKPRKRGVDKFILFALIALAMAVAALGYAFYCWHTTEEMIQEPSIEQLRVVPLDQFEGDK